VVLSDEALIAAQTKRLTKKRERKMGWRDDWRSDCRVYPGVALGQIATNLDRTYADLYPPKYQVLERGEYTPHPPELSHTEWAEGYKEWAERKYDEIARDILIVRHRKPCFAENEI
jgi:hypothetical protein